MNYKKSMTVLLAGAIISLASCGGNAEPKEYATAYCDCLKEKKDATGSSKENLDACFEEVNGKVGKLKKDDIPKFREHMKETDCAIEGMGE